MDRKCGACGDAKALKQNAFLIIRLLRRLLSVLRLKTIVDDKALRKLLLVLTINYC